MVALPPPRPGPSRPPPPLLSSLAPQAANAPAARAAMVRTAARRMGWCTITLLWVATDRRTGPGGTSLMCFSDCRQGSNTLRVYILFICSHFDGNVRILRQARDDRAHRLGVLAERREGDPDPPGHAGQDGAAETPLDRAQPGVPGGGQRPAEHDLGRVHDHRQPAQPTGQGFAA